jgi:hypothetical protein
MSAIKIDTLPGKLEYQNGDEDLDLSGIVVMGTRQGSTTLELVDTSRVKTSGFDKFKAGSQTITVTLGGKTATFKVTVGPNLFVGTWAWVNMEPKNTGYTARVDLQMTEDAWTLTEIVIGDGTSRDNIYNGTYTRDNGRHANLVVKDDRFGTKRSADIISLEPLVLKLAGFRSSVDNEQVRLTKR